MDKKRNKYIFNRLVFHFRPQNVPESNLIFNHTWGLGGISATLVILLFITGILLQFVYEPLPGNAYDSIVYLQNDVLFGRLIRNIHHWSANILVLAAFLHMMRVYFTGGFHHPRRFNWIIGLFLFFLVLISNFTGYLLPWDQLGFWAVTICTGMVEYIPLFGSWLLKIITGGSETGSPSILFFFTIHTSVIPVFLITIMMFHFWHVRKAGGIVSPVSLRKESWEENSGGKDNNTKTVQHLIVRELVAALVLIAFIMVFSILFDVPLQEKANPGLSPNPAKAPWYFMGIQEIFLHFHPLFTVFIIPVIFTSVLIFLPYIKYDSDVSGAWFFSRKGRKMGVVACVTAIFVTPLAVIYDEFFVDLNSLIPQLPEIINTGLFPVFIIIAAITIFYIWIKNRYSASNNETIQAVFILLSVSFVILTITGVWFRGSGMALAWPFTVL
ncbi:MAG: cytochrome bc complex cytochrome b subunit [Desulfobacterales bacterium]|nr:cytochrome bc complex cytochrome b subunit [Desulfobacterales bacterium]